MRIPQPRVISVVRVSTPAQGRDDRAGLARQRADIATAVRVHNLDVVETLEAVDVSGRHTGIDPGFQKLWQRLSDADIDGVVTSEQSRLLRPADFAGFAVLSHFQKNRKKIFTATGCVDLTTPEGRVTAGMTSLMSGEELHTLVKRCNDGRKAIEAAGRCASGPQTLPRGLRWLKTFDENGKVLSAKWTHDERWVGDIKLAYKLLLGGSSIGEITRRLGGRWSEHGVKNSLANPVWIGQRAYRYEATGEEFAPSHTRGGRGTKMRRRTSLRLNPVLVPIALKPILTKTQWVHAQELLATKRTVYKQRAAKKDAARHESLARGLVYCKCGKPMYKRESNARPTSDSYQCSARLKAKRKKEIPACDAANVNRLRLEALLIRIVGEELLRPEFLRSVVKAACQHAAATPGKADGATRATLDAELERIQYGFIKGLVSEKVALKRKGEIEAQLRKLDIDAARQPEQLSVHEIATGIAKVFANIGNLPYAEKRELMMRAVRSVTVQDAAIGKIVLSGGFLGTISAEEQWSNSGRAR